MAVVIRLQGLPVVAGSADIRRFFSGLSIPDGGVHIIGGEKGEAFIIFSTDEDARQAMSYSGGFIKDSRIEFFLSSKTEMQTIIELSRKRRVGSINSGASGIGNLSNLVAAINKGINKSMDPLENEFRSNGSRNSDTDILEPNYNQPKKEAFPSLYLFIRGMPYSATEDDVRNFFSGLQVEGIAMRKVNGKNNGEAVVKFATLSDATEGLQRDREYMGSRFIIVRTSGKGTWIKFGGEIGGPFSTKHFSHHLDKETFSSSREHSRREPDYLSSRKRTCSRSPERVMAHTHSRSPAGRITSHAHSRSPAGRDLSRAHSRSPGRVKARPRSRSPRRVRTRTRSRSPRRVRTHTRSRSPRRVRTRTRSRSPPQRVMARTWSRSPQRRFMMRTRSRSPPQKFTTQSHSPISHSQNREYYILIKNLLPTVEKKDLIKFFGHPGVTASPVIFLKPEGEAKTKDAIVLCESFKVYEFILTFHKEELLGQPIFIFPVSKEKLLFLTGSSEAKIPPERQHHANERSDRDENSGLKTCIYVRNFPFDVTNVEVQKFFAGFNIDKSDIYLLYDDKGIGLGEALVNFRTEEQARKAESLNRRRFLGTEVLLRCISEEQMQEFGINISSTSNEKIQDNLRSYERGEHFYPSGSQGSSLHGNLKHLSNYRHPPDDFISSSDLLRGPPGDGIPGSFQEGHFRPDYNSSGGSDRVTLIKLKNIPFQASPNEILDFFHGYKIIPESLSILRNEYGMSSGEAILAMMNYNEAVAAINELNDRPIGKRKVSLTFG
ncbi:RNA-binding protein 12B [Zootoca vivipara]|uniref:RNA-binding protein 12B n=1 Tax=Zootoca vivipara TaxID=8524 RepID=UPI0015907AFB|nr:RNA-binding protein 12B [Zootoca vivipara]XP_034980729.1 RNA-binding protein 12B [Zootoca vivipara]XP_034980730.1 RNA-binding protein 12B [Zootoca vivipara]XP_060133694.1 RNA-binding protein 12B [Zootoca vivipara]